MKTFNLLFLVASLILVVSSTMHQVHATLGLDLSYFQGEVSQDSWKCLHDKGYQFAIIQAYRSNGVTNPYVATDIARAKAAGFKNVDIYVFPSFAKGIASAGTQLKTAVEAARSKGQNFGMVWIDIEESKLWGNCSSNQAFLRGMLHAGEAMGLHLGIYSSAYQWTGIMCSSTEFSHYPIWYSHYDNKPNFSDWKPFGGWTKPSIKQYTGTTNMCNTQIDQNFY